jgi:hypothetical protein
MPACPADTCRPYPDLPVLKEVTDDSTRIVVSEPIGAVPGAWNEVPESCYGVVGGGDDELHQFKVKPPAKSVTVGV